MFHICFTYVVTVEFLHTSRSLYRSITFVYTSVVDVCVFIDDSCLTS